MSETITILKIFISSGHDFKGRFEKGRLNNEVSSVESVECVAGRGLQGDRYFDFKEDYKGQLSLMSSEAIKALESELGIKVENPADFRRNAITSGLDLNALVGRRFRLGGLELEGVEQCKPCFWMDEAIAPGAFDALAGRGGLRCRILSDGVLRKGALAFEVIRG